MADPDMFSNKVLIPQPPIQTSDNARTDIRDGELSVSPKPLGTLPVVPNPFPSTIFIARRDYQSSRGAYPVQGRTLSELFDTNGHRLALDEQFCLQRADSDDPYAKMVYQGRDKDIKFGSHEKPGKVLRLQLSQQHWVQSPAVFGVEYPEESSWLIGSHLDVTSNEIKLGKDSSSSAWIFAPRGKDRFDHQAYQMMCLKMSDRSGKTDWPNAFVQEVVRTPDLKIECYYDPTRSTPPTCDVKFERCDIQDPS